MRLLNKILKVLNDRLCDSKERKTKCWSLQCQRVDESCFKWPKYLSTCQVLDSQSRWKGNLLHCLSIPCPKGAFISNVKGFELFMRWAIENGYKLNLGHIIMHHLIHTRTKNHVPLPNRLCITKIYKHFGGDLSKE